MPSGFKRKTVGKNNAGLYQAGRHLSTQEMTLAGLAPFVQQLFASQPPHVWLLSGPLGAGKTTLAQEIGRALGVRGAITSPTFSLQKIHPTTASPWKFLVHLDLYRVKSLAEVAALDLDEHLKTPTNLVVVEWPERLPEFSWGPHLSISLTPTSRSRRRVTVRMG